MSRRRTASSVAAPVRASSAQDWRTPHWLVERVHVLMGGPPDIDPCAPPDNPLGARRFFCGPAPSPGAGQGPLFGDPVQAPNTLDGLTEPWGPGTVWLNPPFATMGEWLDLVCDRTYPACVLLPCNRLETDAYHALFRVAPLRAYLQEPGTEHMSNRRVAFERPDGSKGGGSPYATMLVGSGWDPERWAEAFGTPWGYCEHASSL